LFLDSGANINAVGGFYSTPLGSAVAEGEPGMVENLLEKGADPNLVWDKSGRSPLWLACRSKNLDYVNKLIEHGADVNGCTYRGSVLQASARGRSVEITEKLIGCGAQVNAVTAGPYATALNAAALAGDFDNLKLLLDHGADVTLTGGTFHSVLQFAAFKSKVPLIRLLLKHGAAVDLPGGKYKTPLQAACAAGRIKTAKLLLLSGANPNIVGGRNGSALQAACIYGDANLVRLLLSYGADPKLAGGWYTSALGAAVLRRKSEVAKALFAEEGISVESIGGKKPHIKESVWNGNQEFIDNVLADEEPLEPFNADSILLPEEKNEETKPSAAPAPLKIVTLGHRSLDRVGGAIPSPSPIGFGPHSMLVPEL
jgi:ankyrin repeat protein